MDLPSGSTISGKPIAKMQISIKALTRTSIFLQVEPMDTIFFNAKSKIHSNQYGLILLARWTHQHPFTNSRGDHFCSWDFMMVLRSHLTIVPRKIRERKWSCLLWNASSSGKVVALSRSDRMASSQPAALTHGTVWHCLTLASAQQKTRVLDMIT